MADVVLPAKQAVLQPLQIIPCAEQDKLCLSLDWNNRRFARHALARRLLRRSPSHSLPPELVVSISDGTCALIASRQSSYEVVESWAAHGFEPWIAAFDCWTPDLIWTGASPAQTSVRR